MAEFTLEQIRAAVRFRGDYQNERKYPNPDVDREIQLSFSEFYALVDKHHQGYWDTLVDVPTVAAQAYVPLPTGCWKTKLIARIDGSETEELVQVGPDALLRYGTQTGRPVAYRLTARGVDLYYVPDAAYTLRILYTPRAPQLAESQPREWFNGWEDYVILSTVIKLDDHDKKPHGDRDRKLAEIALRVEDEAAQRKQHEPEYLRLREYDGIADIFGDL